MVIVQDLTILIVDIYHFLIVPYSPFQKMKHWNLDIIGYWAIGAGC